MMFRLVLFNLLFYSVVFAFEPPDSSKEIGQEPRYSWSNSVYFAGGWGSPLGVRLEAGYNFGKIAAIGFALGVGDQWSDDPSEATFAALGSVRFPWSSLPFTPYIQVCKGGTFTILGDSHDYVLLTVGSIFELNSGVQLRAELGAAFTSKYTGGGLSLWGPSTPSTKENKRWLAGNVSIEINFASFAKR